MEYYSTGIYKQNLLTAFGCDSTVRLNLTVNKSTITRSNDTLQATTLNAISYQWINCTTGTSIVGANAQTYNPTQSGNYAVVSLFKDTRKSKEEKGRLVVKNLVYLNSLRNHYSCHIQQSCRSTGAFRHSKF